MEYVLLLWRRFFCSHTHTGIVQVVHAPIWYDHRLDEKVVNE